MSKDTKKASKSSAPQTKKMSAKPAKATAAKPAKAAAKPSVAPVKPSARTAKPPVKKVAPPAPKAPDRKPVEQPAEKDRAHAAKTVAAKTPETPKKAVAAKKPAPDIYLLVLHETGVSNAGQHVSNWICNHLCSPQVTLAKFRIFTHNGRFGGRCSQQPSQDKRSTAG